MGEAVILVWFYTLDYFGYFCYMDGHFMDFVILRDSIAYHGAWISTVLVVYECFKRLTDFGGNFNFCEVLCFLFFRLFLCYKRELYGFCDLRRLHSSSKVHRGGLGVSYGVDYFLRKLKFWFGSMLSIVLVVFGSGMDGLYIS